MFLGSSRIGNKKARQGVVGLCRASGIYYKREKKVDTSAYFLSISLWLLYAATHNQKLYFPWTS